MVTPELIEYVRQQLAAGHKKDGLRTLLVANGWQEADINEAYGQIDKSPKSRTKMTVPPTTLVLVGILVVLLIGAGIYWYMGSRNDDTSVADTSATQATVAPTDTPAISPTAMAPVSLALNIPTIIGETGLQATYTSQSDATTYLLSVQNPQNTACPAQDISLSTTATYTCGTQSFTFQLQPDQSTADAATVLVTVATAE